MDKDQVIQHNALIDRIRKGENEAVKALYKMTYNYCTAFIVQNKGSQTDAKEVYQKSLVILLEKIQKSDFTISTNLKTYLYSICRFQWLGELKRRGKYDSIYDEEGKEQKNLVDDTGDLEAKIEQESRIAQIFKHLDTASAECQKIIQLTFFKKLSDKEIAPLLNYSTKFVRTKRSRCIQAIRKKVSS